MKIDLGSNVIVDCDAALVVNGTEVFRLRERGSDDRLVCDFDLRGENGKRIAKIAKSRIVFAADGYQMHDLPRECYVEAPDGRIIAQVKEIGHDEIAITGDFWIDGYHVIATTSALVLGGVTMSGNVISGFGKAVALNPDSIEIGTA